MTRSDRSCRHRKLIAWIGCLTVAGGCCVAWGAEKAVSPAEDRQGKPATNESKVKGAGKSNDKAEKKNKKSDVPPPDEWGTMDYGPFLMTSVARPTGKPLKVQNFESANVPNFPVDQTPDLIAARGIVIPVGATDDPKKPSPATICFNTETLGMTGWTGGWLDLRGTMFANHKGTFNVTLNGQEALKSTKPIASGKLEFLGQYVNGRQTILSYRVDGVSILDVPGYMQSADKGVFSRTLRIDKHAQPLNLNVGSFSVNGIGMSVGSSDNSALFHFDGDDVILELKPSNEPVVKFLNYGSNPGAKRFDPATLVAGGDPLWEPIVTQGVVGKPTKPTRTNRSADPSFAVDTLTLPTKNPANSWMRLGAVDFFADGRAAVCTLNGDVWVVSGIDESLKQLTWTRFATGLNEPLGIAVVDGKVCVRGRDQLTRLHDLNGDGYADFYENLSSEGGTHPSYHALVFDLLADPAGNFYYARGGLGMDPALPNFGRLIRLDRDGRTTALATGLRQPNGLGLVGDGWITVSDNQGNWIPSSKIHLVDPKQAGSNESPAFLGYLPHHHQESMPKEPAAPLVWIPHTLDNSSGGQCEVPPGPWGDYAGQWIHTSFGSASVMMLLPDGSAKKGELPKQAAVARLPLDFATGVMRPRFSPADKQLYVAGVGGGWQTKGTADGGLYRVRRILPSADNPGGVTPTGYAVVPQGVRLSFPQPLDKKEAADPQNYAVEQWNYKWTEQYGSPEFSARTPGKAGHDEVEVTAASVSEDGRSVTLTLAGFQPVQQLFIKSNLFTDDGAEFQSEVFATVNQLAK